MLRRVRLRRDGVGWVLRVTDGKDESNEHIPSSPGDRLLHDRIRELGVSESTEELLKGGRSSCVPAGTSGRCRKAFASAENRPLSPTFPDQDVARSHSSRAWAFAHRAV